MANAKIVNGVLIVKHRQAALAEIESLLKDLAYQVNAADAGLSDNGAASEGVRFKRKAPARRTDEPQKEGQDPFDAGNIDEDDPFAADIKTETDSAEDPFAVGGNTAGRSPVRQN